TIVFGVLPIAIGLGAGGEARRPLGISVVGGMLFSTFLTLVLVPVVYTLMARFTKQEETAEEAVASKSAEPAREGFPVGIPATARGSLPSE
ncbi:MAG: efflux RND transporter permease subunit, partial [Limisphaerales bacterium]